jgi:hypothetical protein
MCYELCAVCYNYDYYTQTYNYLRINLYKNNSRTSLIIGFRRYVFSGHFYLEFQLKILAKASWPNLNLPFKNEILFPPL